METRFQQGGEEGKESQVGGLGGGQLSVVSGRSTQRCQHAPPSTPRSPELDSSKGRKLITMQEVPKVTWRVCLGMKFLISQMEEVVWPTCPP